MGEIIELKKYYILQPIWILYCEFLPNQTSHYAVNNPSLAASLMAELTTNGNKEKTRQGFPTVGQRSCLY